VGGGKKIIYKIIIIKGLFNRGRAETARPHIVAIRSEKEGNACI
jgi:hypothetical protein